MKNQNTVLRAVKEFDVRFSEVDSMQIVWHGSYALYFEDAREVFGAKYDLGYLKMAECGFYAPLVELNFQFKSPLTYRDKGLIEISFRDTEAAKIIFDYKITNLTNQQVAVTGTSVQVFLDKNYQLLWTMPDFFKEWKKINHLL
ncbi:MAG: thioesterase family protein [Bacteroidales bacterium]|nr:thioesterase family protein [Bacteroidales bacterium]